MAFPQLIGTPLTRQQNGTSGPWLIGSAIYVQLLNNSTDAPQIWKTTDLTSGTTWAQVGPDGTTPGGGVNVSSVLAGTKIYVFYNDVPGSGDLLVDIFDTGTNSWSGSIDTGLTAPGPSNTMMGMSYRAADNTIILMADVDSFFDGALHRCAYTVYDIGSQTASAWTACGQTAGGDPNDWFPIYNPVVPGTTRTHFFFASVDESGTVDSFLVQQTLEDGGTLEAFAIVDTQNSITLPTPFQWNAASDGTNVIVQWEPFDPPVDVFIFQGTSAATITFAGQSVPSSTIVEWSVTRGSDGFAYLLAFDFNVLTVVAYVDSGGGFGSAQTLGSFSPTFLTAVSYSGGAAPAMIVLSSAGPNTQWFNFVVFTTPVASNSYAYTS